MTTNSKNRVSFGAVLKLALGVLVVSLLFAAPAFAGPEGSGWELTAHTTPTYLPPQSRGTIEVDVFNVGAGASSGTITVTDTLPAGLTASEAGELDKRGNGIDPTIGHSLWDCAGNGPGGGVAGATVVTCTNDPVGLPGILGGGGAPSAARSPFNLQPKLAIVVNTGAAASALTNRVTVAGGGAPAPASTSNPVTVSAETPPFGFTGWDGWFSNADGTLDTQAGSHPYEATFSYDLADSVHGSEELLPAAGEARDMEVRLPPGIVGDPTAVPQCTRPELDEEACPEASEIGTDTTYFGASTPSERGFSVYNMVPPPGGPAEFGFTFIGLHIFLSSTVRAGGDDGLTTKITVPQKEIIRNVLTLWGFPGEASHNVWREGEVGGCTKKQIEEANSGTQTGDGLLCATPQFPLLKPFLTLPTSCSSANLPVTIWANTWQNPNVTSEKTFELHDSSGAPTGLTGCENLAFGPRITTSPDTSDADTPAGLTVDVKPPVGGLQERGQLGTADIEDTKVELPEGFVINPGQAAGLQACQPAQADLTTEAEKAAGEEDSAPVACPNASKVGTVKIESPLIEGSSEKQFEGDVYVLQSNPPELKLLVAASADGINLKLIGIVHLNEQTGRLTTTFEGTPELPFTDFKLSFSGGPQAALDTPTQCGSYETTADFTPWSNPFIPDFLTNASFNLVGGPGGGACPSNPLPFSPSLIAGSTTDQAGGFTDFSLLLQRGDGQQRIEKLSFKAPAGLSGIISSVSLCGEAQANAGTCPAASHIGHAVVSSGPGPYPLVLPQSGEPELPIYLTGPYDGAPFGLSIVTPVLAGPFNLGTIVTRAKIEVDPHTAQITVTTNPLPQIVSGVPTDLRSIDAVIDRPGFMFNPTNCKPQSFSGTATSAEDAATAPISSPFGVGSCQSLKFAPKFSVSTPGKTTKAGGAGLTAKLTYPVAAQGTQANITRVKVDLPKQLPSRLTTLQKACTNAQFELNPANCPKESKIGMAVVHTALLPVPLAGPAIFVSHGGEAFPSLTMVLQGDNVTVDLVGTTYISHAGITSTTFKTVPDVPFTTFELTLGQGKFSALAANLPAKDHGNFCGQTLKMPTEFVAQNGLKINESTKVAVSGCSKKIKKVSKKKHARAKKVRKK